MLQGKTGGLSHAEAAHLDNVQNISTVQKKKRNQNSRKNPKHLDTIVCVACAKTTEI